MKRSRILLLVALVSTVLLLACVSSYPPSGPYGEPDYRYGHPYYPPRDRTYGYSNDRFAALAHELDDRAARAHELAESHVASFGPREQEFFARIHHFSDEARSFHERYESGQINSRGSCARTSAICSATPGKRIEPSGRPTYSRRSGTNGEASSRSCRGCSTSSARDGEVEESKVCQA